jgi:hypothetical protein
MYPISINDNHRHYQGHKQGAQNVKTIHNHHLTKLNLVVVKDTLPIQK